jgi:hypothetical protein
MLHVNFVDREPDEVKSGSVKIKGVDSLRDLTKHRSAWLYDEEARIVKIRTETETSVGATIRILMR